MPYFFAALVILQVDRFPAPCFIIPVQESFAPFLGLGVGLRGKHYSHFRDSKPQSIDWVEALSENYMRWKSGFLTQSIHTLEKVRAHCPVVLHGVSLSIGAADALDQDYLNRLKELIDRIEPGWVSDHLCWTGIHHQSLHDLYPLPYTEEALATVTRKVDQVQEFLKRPLLLENVSSYIDFTLSEMTEWEFLTELSERSGCGILLDINNIYVSAVNHGTDALEYLDAIPPEKVGHIHLAGHTNLGDHLIDTHSDHVCDEVWNLYHAWITKHGPFNTMIEWDAEIPEWPVLEAEALQAKSYWKDNHARKNLISHMASTVR